MCATRKNAEKPKPKEPLTYANMTPEERARRQAIMDTILAKHERDTRSWAWLKELRPRLMDEIKAWEDCESIRKYVAMLDARIAAGQEADAEYEKWRADALKAADALDPTYKRVKAKS